MIPVMTAPVVANERLPRDNWMLTARAPQIAQISAPGQFLMASEGVDLSIPSPLLRRALAIYSIGLEEGRPTTVRLLVKTVGDGTRRLAALVPGDRINLIGPLGRGFQFGFGKRHVHVLLAGGVGIASVFLLAQRLAAMDEEVHLIYGGRSRDDLVCLQDFERLGVEVALVTEDGSAGSTGLITEGLRKHMERFPSERLLFYACGPNPMLRAVSQIAIEHAIPCQVSVETRMGCGFGVCLGCTVRTVDSYRLACQHGPVFRGDELNWREDPAWSS